MAIAKLKRYGGVLEVPLASGETTTQAIPVGEFAWGSVDVLSGAFNPASFELQVTNGEVSDFNACVDKDGAQLPDVTVTNRKALLPLEAFYFKSIRLVFNVAPGADTTINVLLKG